MCSDLTNSAEGSQASTASDVTRRTFVSMASGLALAMGAEAGAAGKHSERVQPTATPTKLYPHSSATRATRDLSGVWKFRADPDRVGETQGWMKGIGEHRVIPVPCSWNELFDDLRNYTGGAWYQHEFVVDRGWSGQRIHLRFGSVAYRAKVWLNGHLLGEHSGPHLPFVFDVTAHVIPGSENVLVVFVENDLRLDRVPAIPDISRVKLHTPQYPLTSYDFFPYTGIHRPVLLFTTPDVHVHDITVRTSIGAGAATVAIALATSSQWSGKARIRLSDGTRTIESDAAVVAGRGTIDLKVPDPRLWSPEDPHLYKLTVTLADATVHDEYTLKIGIREVRVDGERLLLNGKPVYLRGFGKHEDFPVHGRGLNVASIVRDFELLKWLGANSFRTAHYPYSEEVMMLADEYGLLVIDETPAVSLVFMDGPAIQEARQQQLRQYILDLVERDKNHPCVLMWSVANEPVLKPFLTVDAEPLDMAAIGTKFFTPLFDLFRKLDPTRPVTMVNVGWAPVAWMDLCDVISVNVYTGWYVMPGRLDEAAPAVRQEALDLHKRHPGKPIFYSEFGADAVAGLHSQPADMWTEEFQAEMIEMYVRTLAEFPFVIGTHPWAFADFRTSQSTMRVAGFNHKGVFTRTRNPKLAAHRLRQLWNGDRLVQDRIRNEE